MHCPGSMEGPDLCPTSPQTGGMPSQKQHYVLVLLRVCF